MSSKKEIKVKSMKLVPEKDKEYSILYIRSVSPQAVDKFEKYAEKLNMSRAKLFETLVIDGLQ